MIRSLRSKLLLGVDEHDANFVAHGRAWLRHTSQIAPGVAAPSLA